MADTTEFERPRIVILLGPTGVGKSGLAIELAEELGGEIVSADSMQVYRYMDIGTAKPTPEERKRVRHHLIDLVTPDQPFHAGLYRTLARKEVDQLHRSKKPIWVVGGTGLYIKVLTQGLFSHPKVDPMVRKRLKEEAEKKGTDFLYQRLKRVDPKTASIVHPGDLFRTLRALEIFDSTGIPISFFREQHRFGERPYLTLKIGLERDRQVLYRRIEERVDQMIDRGLLEEVKGLMEMGYGADLKPMQGLGYRQMVQFLSKEIGWAEAIRQIKRDTRHYAKRQWTWFKADPEIRWRDVSADRQRIFLEVKSFLRGGG
ncbi:MAG: tRNA (adenosine(37)-N6)-dimethylallyltransferase MiaA [Syntrophaceae bacterium]|nr:tRNA (adenosine(37)-N6)-dimethylallyltransferase MiaA [Syntrophaceae bacterium]